MFNGALKKEVKRLSGRVQQLETIIFNLTHKKLEVKDLSVKTVVKKAKKVLSKEAILRRNRQYMRTWYAKNKDRINAQKKAAKSEQKAFVG